VWVHAEDCEPICGRLVAVRLPADKAETARERLRREQGSEVTAESLAMAGFVVVFTTVPKEIEDWIDKRAIDWTSDPSMSPGV
jgi:hypothetical protein